MTSRPDIWTPEIVAELSRRWNAKDSAETIARALKLTKNQVIGKVHRLGLKPHGLPPGFTRPQNRLPKRAPAIVKTQQTLRLNRETEKPQRKCADGPVIGGCRFITGDDFIERMNRGKNIYCGETIAREGESYCEHHRAICITKAKPLPESEPEITPRKQSAA